MHHMQQPMFIDCNAYLLINIVNVIYIETNVGVASDVHE